MNKEQAKEKQEKLKSLLNDQDVICLYISPTESPADFLTKCWHNDLVDSSRFMDALKGGFFDQFIANNADVDVYIWTHLQAEQFMAGNILTQKADNYISRSA